MFNRDNTVKIGDFGLVTPVIQDDSENQRERRGYKGTPSYMAPEQVGSDYSWPSKLLHVKRFLLILFSRQKNRTLYDRKVDIFALGLIFFELLWTIPTIDEKSKVR